MAKKATKPPKGFPFSKQLFEAILDGGVSLNNLPKELFDYTFFQLTDQLAATLDTDSVLFNKMANNVGQFSANKTFQEVANLVQLKTELAGMGSSVFFDSAAAIDKMFNVNWLAVEKDAAFKMGVSAQQWTEVEESKDLLPLLRYSTIKDARVREEHVLQEGKTYPVDHPYWDTWYPPNGWRCRCDVTQIERGKTTPGKWAGNDDPVFGINPGKAGKAFKETHPYFDVPNKFKKSQKNNFGLT